MTGWIKNSLISIYLIVILGQPLYAQSNFATQFKQAIALFEKGKYGESLVILDNQFNSLFADYLDLYRLKNLYYLKNFKRIELILERVLAKNSHLKKDIILQHFSFQKPAFFLTSKKHLKFLKLLPGLKDKADAMIKISNVLFTQNLQKKAFEFNQKALQLFKIENADEYILTLQNILSQSFKQMKAWNYYKKVDVRILVRILLFAALDNSFPKYDNLIYRIQKRIHKKDIFYYRYILLDKYYRKRQYSRARRILKILQKMPVSSKDKLLETKMKFFASDLALKAKKFQKALKILTELEKERIYNFKVNLKKLNIFKIKGDLPSRLLTYKKLLNSTTNPYFLQRYTRDYLNLALMKKVSIKIYPHIQKLLKIIPTGTYMEEVLYLGYLNKNQNAKAFCLQNLKKFHPFSFFLRKIEPQFKYYVEKSNRDFLKEHPQPLSKYYKRAVILEKIELFSFALREYNLARKDTGAELRILLKIAALYNKEKKYKEAISLFDYVFNKVAVKDGSLENIPPLLWRGKYPSHYSKTIHYWVRKFDSSSPLSLAIIREESRFDKNARSRSWARGLMQIMARTASWIQKARKKRTVLKKRLYDYKTNIELGIWYINYLIGDLNNTELAVCAYNGGIGNVKKWLKKSDGPEILKFWMQIPLAETRRYLYKVMTSFHTYRAFYY
ncbi:transglycosylase SLT domain-containing protein [Candidatus Riflebacteria bacterium]